jgi:hypothetical protein
MLFARAESSKLKVENLSSKTGRLIKPLISFRSRNVQFSASSRKSAALRGGVLVYAAQAIPPIDAEIAEKGPFMDGNYLTPSGPR